MNVYARLFQPLRRAWAAIFLHDLALRRAESGVRIVFQARPAKRCGTLPPGMDEAAAQRAAQELQLMRQQLGALLDEGPETRQTMRHLASVERALTRMGLRALRKLPPPVLRRGLRQLEGLVTNWTPAGLAALRSKLAVVLIEREQVDGDGEASVYRTSAMLEDFEDDGQDDSASEASRRSEHDALAAAYALLGDMAPPPAKVEMQGELGSASTRAALGSAARRASNRGRCDVDIPVHELER